jgi:hypothetical protein
VLKTNDDEETGMAEKSGFEQLDSANAEDRQMAQIREILFGEQSRLTEQRLSEIEQAIESQVTRLGQLMEQRISQSMEQLRQDLEKQGLRHQAALDGLDNALRRLLQGLDDKITLVDSDVQDNDQRQTQALAQQAAAHERLASASVDRKQLANLLDSMARQLREDSANG